MGRSGMAKSEQRSLIELLDVQALGCELAGSPIYGRVLGAVSKDVADGGRLATILRPIAPTAMGDAAVLRFLAAVHELVLEGSAPELAAHYPSAGGVPGPGLERTFLDTVQRFPERVSAALDRPVQTNEPARSAALLGGYLTVAARGLPLRILEIGASAGLNLRFDEYRYVAGERGFGPVDSPVRFEEPFVGAVPDLDVTVDIASRRGCDPLPIDPASESGRRRLRSLVWPDQIDRLARLDAALQVAAKNPVAVDRADAVEWLTEQLSVPVPGVATVVAHSIVLQYLSAPDRQRVVALIEAAGRRATVDAPVAWLRMEPGGDQAEVRLVVWPDPVPKLLARSGYHGPPVVWSGPGA